ncbi:hypothetical protein SOVF_007090 [Spinacia oleracea]|nr:hypothetical protein SOVF_007090 [Spinacia oleracea]
MESMSNAPKYIADSRKGFCLGHDTLVDGMLKDGLWDVYNYCGMGVCAESCAEHHAVTREDQVKAQGQLCLMTKMILFFSGLSCCYPVTTT